MGRMGRTWDLAKASWEVLRKDKELMVLPLLSGLLVLTVALAFIAPLLLVGNELSGGAEELDPGPIGYLFLFVGYMVITFIGQFFNAALVAGAYERMTGGDPTISSSLRGATSRFHVIAPWAAIAGTVGLILTAIENQGTIGEIVARLLNFAWRVITFLVVPILVIEDIGPIDAIKRSSTLFKKTWGENLAAQFGFGLLALIAILPGALVGGLLISTGVGVAVGAGVLVIAVTFTLAIVATTALTGIFQTALYLYAAHDLMPAEFAGTDLPNAYKLKKARTGGTSGNR